MKKLKKNITLLAFAAAMVVMIGGNIFASPPEEVVPPDFPDMRSTIWIVTRTLTVTGGGVTKTINCETGGGYSCPIYRYWGN